MSSSEPQFVDYAIVPHPSEPRVLLLPSENGWLLPHVYHHERHFWQSVAPVNQAVGALLGMELTTLRCMWTDYWRTVYAMENHSAGWRPPAGAAWFSSDQVAELSLARPELREQLSNWFAAQDASAAPRGVPWYRAGWYAEATEWIRAQLDRLSLPAAGSIEQLRSWERSAILRAHTAAGDLYFKAAPPMFAHEPALTQALAERDPARFPAVLAVDTERCWMLMPDHGGRRLDQIPDVDRWELALRRFARLQIALSADVGRFVGLGCPSRPLELLAAQIDPLLSDTAALTSASAALDQREIAELRALGPRLRARCAELAGYGLPLTLEHGDFWPGQVLARDDGDVFIDWSDSSVAHPFFSMSFFSDTTEAEEFLPGIADLRSRMRDAYLEPWNAYEPAARLVEAYELAQQLAPLHNAITYHVYILPGMQAKWEMHNMISFYLRKLLRPGS
jgi:hypothetical protein